MSRDPLVAQTREAYGYVGNSPLNRTDPSGMIWPFDEDDNTALSGTCVRGVNCGVETQSLGESWGQSFREAHPETAQGIVDFSSGALSVNPITAATNALGLTDTGQCGNSSSWWYHSGQAAMILTDLWAAGGLGAGRLAETESVGKGSTLFGRGGGLLNSNDVARLGWNWKGTAMDGQDVFRLVLGNKSAAIHWHLVIWEVGSAL